ncbi:hypothetical protein D3C76_1615970 [compost metagenome]
MIVAALIQHRLMGRPLTAAFVTEHIGIDQRAVIAVIGQFSGRSVGVFCVNNDRNRRTATERASTQRNRLLDGFDAHA